jgi:glyoxylase-like metal-dependent hydrolase (beta-lactamase superfamily II)
VDISISPSLFIEPAIEGFETFNGIATSYLIENKHLGRKAVFDLGLRKDWWNLAPKIGDGLALGAIGVKVDKDVAEILQESDIPLQEIDDIIWSHAHLDHTGDASRFPPSTRLNYGKEIAALKPEYPEQLDAVLLESDFTGRANNEIDFSQSSLQIGGFSAIDFFEDGSFYLINAPGHAPGHLCGLARTTSSVGQGQDTFILLAGDTCHFCGVMRPNDSHQFPTPNFPESALGVTDWNNSEVLLRRHPLFLSSLNTSATEMVKKASVTPWCRLSTGEHTAHADPELAQMTADKVRKEFDEADNVLVVLSHDINLLLEEDGRHVLPTLNHAPEKDLNDWYEKDWKEKMYWSWVNQLGTEDEDGKIRAMAPRTVGLWKNGKIIEKKEIIHQSF